MHTLAMTIRIPCLMAESHYLYEKDISQATELITVLKPSCVYPYVHACTPVCACVWLCNSVIWVALYEKTHQAASPPSQTPGSCSSL